MLSNLLAAGAGSSEIIAQRVFNPLYIYLDIAFLVLLCVLLFIRKRYLTLLFGLAGGVLYMIVDYGIFHLALGTRSIEGGNLFWVLLWMSMSYGITNFVWVWLWMGKDKFVREYTMLICVWWIAAPLIANTFGADFGLIKIQRTTGAYHGAMAIILFVTYAAAIAYNLFQKDKSRRFPLLYLFMIGVTVQFAWEFSLLIGGIRSAEISDWGAKLTTLVVNSLLETNLGAVPIFCIFVRITQCFTEHCKTRADKVSFAERIAEINGIRLREHYKIAASPVGVQAKTVQEQAEVREREV